MAAPSRKIAQAVVDELNGAPAGTFSQSFTAERKYVPLHDVEGLQTQRVVAFGLSLESELADRQKDAHEQQVQIGVQKKLPSFESADVDPWLDFVDEIAVYLNRRLLAGFPSAIWRRTEVTDPQYFPEHLRKLHVFTSVLTISYVLYR